MYMYYCKRQISFPHS